MNISFGEGYITQVKNRQGSNVVDDDLIQPGNTNAKIVTIVGDVALDQLLRILLTLNGSLIFVVPAISWYLAKRTLNPVQKIHEQQKQFVSDVSHELRTPLSIISGELEIVLKKERTINEYKKTIISNKEEVARLNKLVENLLFLAREEQKKQALQFESVDITDTVSTSIATLHKNAQNKHQKIIFVPPHDSIALKGSESLLRQLFINIIDNAIKYTPTKGIITITIHTKDKNVEIAVKDTGDGIGNEHKTKIFDRFYRADSSRSEIKGYGLGLSIAQAIVKRHHGSISLTSQVGHGSMFVITLPNTY